MSRRSQHLPGWPMPRGHYDPNSGWGFAETMDRLVVESSKDNTSQQSSDQRIALQDSVLNRVAGYHVHDPLYHRPTYNRQPMALYDRLQLSESESRNRRWGQPHAPEPEPLQGLTNTMRSPIWPHRPVSPVHLCCSANSPVEQLGSYAHNIPATQTMSTFPHGLPVAYEPHIGDTASYRPLPSQVQIERTRVANPNPWNWTDAQGSKHKAQDTDIESTYSMKPPHTEQAPSAAAPLIGPEETQHQHIQDEATQPTALDWDHLLYNEFPQELEGVMSDSSSGVYTPSSPRNSLETWDSIENNMESNASTRTMIGDEDHDVEEPDTREDMGESQGTQHKPMVVDDRARHTVDNTTATRDSQGNEGFTDEYLGDQRTGVFPVNMDPSHRRPQWQQSLSPPMIYPAMSSQRERTQLTETRDIAAERLAEDMQRSTITVEGNCYINLSSPNELLSTSQSPLQMMPFLRVRGNLYIRTTARTRKRKRDESSEDDSEADSNVGYDEDAKELDHRPAKRR
ncbi:hypothetical protein K449DRAFT_394173 [Hypoxylon sp. EC38]|nr:hypothetical protein K449DRAFT_394173 [Hypoxylon sp. EC38]